MRKNPSEFSRRQVLKNSATALVASTVPAALASSGVMGNESIPPESGSQGPSPSLVQAKAAVAQIREPIVRISREVWAFAERSLLEARSAEVLIRELEAAGFRTLSRGTGGVPTNFVTEWKQGNGGPIFGFLPEYDALPDLGNAAEPRKTPAPSGITSGHGCGHNILGAGCVGGAIALKNMVQGKNIPVTIRVYGCAAEESQGGKAYMARAGSFDDVDIAFSFHSAGEAGAGLVTTTANRNNKVEFFGRSAHAGNEPWMGRSALDAAELLTHAINLMREHIQPTSRMHYVYESGGVAPNVVPDYARVWLTLRAVDTPQVTAMNEWAKQIAEGAAMATQTRAVFKTFVGYPEIIPNEPLARLAYKHITGYGLANEWTAEEQTFAKTCQKELGVPETGLATKPFPFLPLTPVGASSDVGSVSWKTPVLIFAWPSLPRNTPLHTWVVTACGGMSIGDKCALASSAILAAAGLDLLADRALLESAQADFKKRLGDRKYVSAIPPEMTRPDDIPDWLIKAGQDDQFSKLPEPPNG